jgi:RHH-type proline utilization regulon transcriptional repressor/proline dehydrogenase/delta 1-pyrroline-5-carboxylate dehydrogenase
LHRFTVQSADLCEVGGQAVDEVEVTTRLRQQAAVDIPLQARVLPGPTGESNRLTRVARDPVLCLGPGVDAALAQAEAVRAHGGRAVEANGLGAEALARLQGFAGAIWWGDSAAGRGFAQALATRQGPILPLIGGMPDAGHAVLERHICIDTTASGGNAQLLAEVSGA